MISTISKKKLLLAGIALLFASEATVAEEIYRWKDSSGNIRYSSTPPETGVEPAELPEIKKEDIDQRIKSIKRNIPDNCIKHGGVDCTKGADRDGSVVCLNGYTHAQMPFEDACGEAILRGSLTLEHPELGFVSLENVTSEMLTTETSASLVTVIRNVSPVRVENFSLSYRVPAYPRRFTVIASGSSTIEPYASEEYSFRLEKLPEIPELRYFKKTSFFVECANCRVVRKD